MLSTATRLWQFCDGCMISEDLKHGGHKRHLEAKIFGGGRMMKSLNDVGAQ